SAVLAAHPLAAHLALAAVLGAGFAAAWRHAGRVSPLADEALRRKDVAPALLVPAPLAAGQTARMAPAGTAPAPPRGRRAGQGRGDDLRRRPCPPTPRASRATSSRPSAPPSRRRSRARAPR